MALTTAKRLDGVEEMLDRVSKRRKKAIEQIDATLHVLEEELKQKKKAIEGVLPKLYYKYEEDIGEDAQDAVIKYLESAQKMALDCGKALGAEHKGYYGTLSKLGKTMDKNMVSTLDVSARREPIKYALFLCDIWKECRNELVRKALAIYSFREGRFELGKLYAKEAQVQLNDNFHAPFVELNRLVELLRAQQPKSALEWAQQHAVQLEQCGCDHIVFLLHKLEYLDLVLCGERRQAVEYARKHFHAFSGRHMTSIKRLAGCLMFAERLDNSPYADLVDTSRYEDAASELSRAYCATLGLGKESPLFVAMAVGAQVLPKLSKMASVLHLPSMEEEEKHIELDVEKQHAYHSVFVCPVSREQGTESNPPMLLKCGHIIARSSLRELAPRGGAMFKCPYCPTEQVLSDAMEIKM